MDSNLSAVICGGGGFIGGHLAGDLIRKGFRRVRVVDIKPLDQWYQVHPEAENIQADLNERSAAFAAVKGMDLVWNLACNMGGMGFIE
ncbi:MAG: NAD-dependent epimerase/dehydratase family protein, partial [Phycisphaerae bacterium]|nr:NAD-dependent epimerase/dehydratase family protein [Phycisphaerae bacterium]